MSKDQVIERVKTERDRAEAELKVCVDQRKVLSDKLRRRDEIIEEYQLIVDRATTLELGLSFARKALSKHPEAMQEFKALINAAGLDPVKLEHSEAEGG